MATDVVGIYERIQGSINIEDQTEGAINDWLIQKHQQTPATFSLARKLSQGNDLFDKDVSYEDVDSYQSEVNTLNSKLSFQQSTLNEFNVKIGRLRTEQAAVVEKQEQAIAEREALKQEIAEARTREDLKQAEKALVEVSPQSLGGIRSGETRRVPKAFATIFE